MLYLLAFGVPGAAAAGHADGAGARRVALVLTYSAYVAEVFRAGIESVHPSQRAAARSLGLTYRQTMRHVVLPQAVRRVAPPLLNDLVALQKDVGLISLVGPIDAVRAAQIAHRRDLQLHAVHRRRAALRAARHPADRGHRLGDAARRRRRQSRRHDMTAPVLRCEGVRKAFGDARRARGRRPRRSPSTRWSR